MWLIHSDSPKEAPFDQLELYIKGLNKLDPSQNWRHIFWCIDKNKIPNTIKFIKNAGVPIEIHETHEVYQKCAQNTFLMCFTKISFSPLLQISSNKMWCIFLEEFMQMLALCLPYLDAYDYIFISSNDFIDQTFFGYKKHDPISNIFLNNLDSLYRLPKSVQQLQPYNLQMCF